MNNFWHQIRGRTEFQGGISLSAQRRDSVGADAMRRGIWLYPFLLAAQTAGAALLYWQGLPIYRELYANASSYTPKAETLLSTTSACLLIQIAYWVSYRERISPPIFVNAVLGHIVLFLSRLIFLLPTLIFSFLFIYKALGSQMPISRYVVIVFGLFSLFCYTRELDRFGNRLLGPKGV